MKSVFVFIVLAYLAFEIESRTFLQDSFLDYEDEEPLATNVTISPNATISPNFTTVFPNTTVTPNYTTIFPNETITFNYTVEHPNATSSPNFTETTYLTADK